MVTDRPEQASPAAVQQHSPASPFRLNLEHQRKRAKELLRALRAGDSDALRRFRTHHPSAKSLAGAEIPERLVRLSEAQLVIARELRTGELAEVEGPYRG